MMITTVNSDIVRLYVGCTLLIFATDALFVCGLDTIVLEFFANNSSFMWHSVLHIIILIKKKKFYETYFSKFSFNFFLIQISSKYIKDSYFYNLKIYIFINFYLIFGIFYNYIMFINILDSYYNIFQNQFSFAYYNWIFQK